MVIGVGGIGTFIVRAAASAGAAATAVDIDPRRLEVAGRLGASTTLDVSSGGIDEIDGETPPDVVFECTGRPESLIRAVSLVADHGRLVVVGHQPEPVAVDFRQVALDELELIGTQAHVFATDLPIAVDLLAADPGVWAIVAPNVYPLDQVVETGLIPLARGDAGQIKLLFDPALQSPRPFDTGV